MMIVVDAGKRFLGLRSFNFWGRGFCSCGGFPVSDRADQISSSVSLADRPSRAHALGALSTSRFLRNSQHRLSDY